MRGCNWNGENMLHKELSELKFESSMQTPNMSNKTRLHDTVHLILYVYRLEYQYRFLKYHFLILNVKTGFYTSGK
jgi:hypothetical protein